MFPGVNPRQMQQMMKKMGINQQELDDVEEVIIRCRSKDIVIAEAQVSKVNMMGQETWQVVGKAQERSRSTMPEISDADVQTVVEQCGCTVEKAKAALEKHQGDLAAAILGLK